MTSGSAAGSNAVSPSAGAAKEERSSAQPERSTPPASKRASSPRTTARGSSVAKSESSVRRAAEGDNVEGSNGHESEAETLLLSDAEQEKTRRKRKAIKAEDAADDDKSRTSSSPRVRRKSVSSADRANGSTDHKAGERSGSKRLTNGDSRKNARSASPDAKSTLRQVSAASDGARKSPSVDAGTSPTAAQRGSAAAAALSGTRKRKLREDQHLRNIEPPRQRLKSEALAKSAAGHATRATPASPTATSPGLRSHKRTSSQQSLATGMQSRTRREASASHDRTQWRSDSSSEPSSSPQPSTPPVQFAPATRKRSSHRSVGSPGRTNSQVAHVKKNVDKFGATRLARECEKGNLDAVKAAYDAAPEELNQDDFAGFAPIQKASLNGHYRVVAFLIKKGCRTDCHSKEHDTPLIDAVENGHLDVVKLLLDAGVNPHHQNKKGERAVDVLNREEDNVEEIEKALRKAMLDHASDDDGISTDSPVMTRDLVEDQRNDLLYVESTLANLRKYAAKGDAVAVDHFLSSISPDTACVTGAARGGHEMVLNLLLAMPSDRMEKDPDPAKHNETPLTAAIGRGHLGILRILLDQDNFNPARRTKDGKLYWELAEERKGPKWQQEVDLLKERLDAYRTKKQAAKKRSLGPHAAEKASKIVKLRGPRSPEVKKVTTKTSSPTPSVDSKAEQRPKIKQEKITDSALNAPLKKTRLVEGSKASQDTKIVRKSVDSLKPRKRRVVDEDDSSEGEDETGGKKSSRVPGRPKKTLEVPSKTRRERLVGVSGQKLKERDRRSANAVDAAGENEDEQMIDAPLPLPSDLATTSTAKQHTPEPVRLRRIAEAEKETDRQRMAAERERLAVEQREAEIVAARLRKERQERLDKLPSALKRACEKGRNRPLHFSAGEMGISMSFLPLLTVPLDHIDSDAESKGADGGGGEWMLSFQAVGILGLQEPDVLRTFPDWATRPATPEQRRKFLRAYDVSLLAHESGMPCEDDDDFDPSAVESANIDARDKFLAMDSLAWIRVADFEAAVQQEDWLADLVLARSPLRVLRDTSGTESPRSFDQLIRGIVTQHQQAMLTPPSATADTSPLAVLKAGSDAGVEVAPAAAPAVTSAGAEGDAMDVDPPRREDDELAPASSGIV